MANGIIRDVNSYKDLHSLNLISKAFLDILMKDLVKVFTDKEIKAKKYIVGYHLRHVFDTDSPFVAIETHSDSDRSKKNADKIKLKNKTEGLHTFNHVLDSMYYPSLKRNIVDNSNNIVFSRVNFTEKSEDNKYFFKKNLHNKYEENIIKDLLEDHFKDFKIKPIDYVGSQNLTDLYKNNIKNFTAGIKEFFKYGVSGINNLCTDLDLENTIVNYNALASTFFQMLTYSSYGKNVITIIIRPKNYFKFVIGISIFSDKYILSSKLNSVIETLKNQNNYLNNYSASKIKQEFDKKTSLYNSYQKGEEYSKTNKKLSSAISNFRSFPVIPLQVSDNENFWEENAIAKILIQEIESDLREEIGLDNIYNLQKSYKNFLRLSINFLHQKDEGKHVKYGLLLGNPFLIKYWKGSSPVPCSQNMKNKVLSVEDDVFFPLKDIPQQIHLICNPEERVLAIPYFSSDEDINQDKRLPAFIIELNDFHETFSSLKENILWVSEHRPYVFLTKRYPWSIACVAGPDSELRVFSRGELIAFRNGMGWKHRQKLDSLLGKIEIPKLLLETLIKCALQLSPYVRNNSKGGFFVYIPNEDDDKNFWKKVDSKVFTSLFDNEPTRWNNKNKWLTGRNILKNDNDKTIADKDVLPLLIQAGSLDGAIVINGKLGQVKFMGQRLNLSKNQQARAFSYSAYSQHPEIKKGSKRAAADIFVAWANNPTNTAKFKGSFAITISSDGPLNVYYFDTKVKIFKIFIEL